MLFLTASHLGDVIKAKFSASCTRSILILQTRRVRDPPELCFTCWENTNESAEHRSASLQLKFSKAINGSTFCFPSKTYISVTPFSAVPALAAGSLHIPPQKNPLCKGILHDLPARSNWAIIFFFFGQIPRWRFSVLTPQRPPPLTPEDYFLFWWEIIQPPRCASWAPSKLCPVIPRRGPRCLLGTEPILQRSINAGPQDGLELLSPAGHPVPLEHSPLINLSM